MLNPRDLLIIMQLRKNARQSLVDISKETKIPVSTIYDKIRSHEKGAIKKHTALLDFQKLGFNIRIKLLLSVKKREDFQKFILSHENINSAYQIDGEYEFMLDCIFRYMADMQDFMKKIEQYGVEKKQMHYVSNELKCESFLEDSAYPETT
ncbi:Lrp/AsnC family transcriptional regulator [Candidatus Woesearchaeota archaeon]|nr:Lrp/AsnC family transcriptional regulator [Candidatus Woesearchaeota archaeon]